jgi:hypothetical protein
MPKCASSALQTYLSTQAFSKDTQNRCAYIALHADGKIVWGEDLFFNAAASPYGYCASHDGSSLSAYTETQKRDAQALIRRLTQEFDTVVLSCESWGGSPETFSDDCLFADIDIDVRVVAYIRPQVEWMNSAWWQWGAWSDVPLLQWVEKNRAKAKWSRVLHEWRSKAWVQHVDLRILDEDIVQDFASYLGAYSASVQALANQGLPDVILRLFQRNRGLRQNAHSSAIEFILSRQMHFAQSYMPTPWVLRPKLIAQLLAYYSDDNARLLQCLSEDQKNKMASNSLWWSPVGYQGKHLHKATDKKLELEELEKLTVDALQVIDRLDARVREFQSNWMKLRDKFDLTPEDLEANGLPIRGPS